MTLRYPRTVAARRIAFYEVATRHLQLDMLTSKLRQQVTPAQTHAFSPKGRGALR